MFGRGHEFDSSFLNIKHPDLDDLTPKPQGYRLGEEAPEVTLSPDYAKIVAEQKTDVVLPDESKSFVRKSIQVPQVIKRILKR